VALREGVRDRLCRPITGNSGVRKTVQEAWLIYIHDSALRGSRRSEPVVVSEEMLGTRAPDRDNRPNAVGAMTAVSTAAVRSRRMSSKFKTAGTQSSRSRNVSTGQVPSDTGVVKEMSTVSSKETWTALRSDTIWMEAAHVALDSRLRMK
jgi:hypothetical protein